MNETELLQALRETRATLDAALADLSNAPLTDPGVTRRGSVRASIAHRTLWEHINCHALLRLLGDDLAGHELPDPRHEVNAAITAGV